MDDGMSIPTYGSIPLSRLGSLTACTERGNSFRRLRAPTARSHFTETLVEIHGRLPLDLVGTLH
jgi:hypothetical protein